MKDIVTKKLGASTRFASRKRTWGNTIKFSSPFACIFFSLVVFANIGCEANKERKPAQKPGPSASPSSSPSSEPTSTPGTTNTGGNGNPTNNNGTPPVAGDAAYMTPRTRPTKVNGTGSGSSTRDVTANDVFITPVYLDSSSWLKICASLKVDGTAAPFLVGCTHEPTQPESGTKQSSTMNPKFVLDSPLTVGLTTAAQRLTLDFQVYSQETNAGCGASGCPGPFPKKVDSARSTASTPQSIKCLKSGSVVVLFIDDKADKDVAADSDFRSKLTLNTGSDSVPSLPNLRNLHDPASLSVLYKEPGGSSTISEKDVRRKFGVDFDDLILQIDLGTSGHTIAGFESCK